HPGRQDVDVRPLDAERVPRSAQRLQPPLHRGRGVFVRLREPRVRPGTANPSEHRSERRILMRPALLAFVFFVIAGCSNNLPKQSIIEKLRILGVQANPAELVVGDSLPAATLTALAIVPSGAPIELRWALCPLPANLPPPASLDCPGSYGIALKQDGSGVALLDLADPSTQLFWDVLFRTPDGTPLTDGQRASTLAAGPAAAPRVSATAGRR